MARRARSLRRNVRRRIPDGPALVSREAFCALSGVSWRELAIWENEDLIVPAEIVEREGRAEVFYDRRALRRARLIRTLAEEFEVNLPGIGIILNLLDQMDG
jgi:DNA-binding transcriptional MerR regulator